MNWNAFHHRGDVLRAVVDEANLRRDGHLPWHLPGVTETFHDELDLVAALQLRWFTHLTGQVERHLQAEPMDLEAAVRRAWVATAESLPGVRAVIDRETTDPSTPEIATALARAAATEQAMLALVAGRSSAAYGRRDPRAVAAGREIVEAARAAYAPGQPMLEPAEAAVRTPARPVTAPVAEPVTVPDVVVETGPEPVAEAAVEHGVEDGTTRRVPSGSAAFVARLKAALAA